MKIDSEFKAVMFKDKKSNIEIEMVIDTEKFDPSLRLTEILLYTIDSIRMSRKVDKVLKLPFTIRDYDGNVLGEIRRKGKSCK